MKKTGHHWLAALVVALLTCALATTAFAAGEIELTQAVITDEFVLTEGTYYLGKDVKLEQSLVVEGTVNLYLNDHMLQYVGSADASVLAVNSGGTLNLYDLYDSGGTGTTQRDWSVDETTGLWSSPTAHTSGANTTTGGVITGGTSSGIQLNEGAVAMTLYSGTIVGNTARDGGGVCLASGNFTMENGTIVGNTAESDGGGVYLENGGNFTMENGTIVGNIATFMGGGVYLDNGGSFHMKNGTIVGNQSLSQYGCGGGVYVKDGGFIMENGSIKGNQAASNGGGVVLGSCTFTMSGGTIGGETTADGNVAATGGGLYLSDVTATMSGGTIQNNVTQGENTTILQGGGLFLKGGTFEMDNPAAKIIENASSQGGGVYIKNSGEFTLSAGSISGNYADGDGGGIYVTNSTFILSGGTIGGTEAGQGNSAKVSGGGLFSNSAFSMSAGFIQGNTAHSGGGVHTRGDVTMTGGTIGGTTEGAANKAIYGGGVCVSSGGDFTMNHADAKIIGNQATKDGGGVQAQGTFTLSAGTIGGTSAAEANTAPNGGGVSVLEKGIFEMTGTNSKIIGNKATGNGGGVYTYSEEESWGPTTLTLEQGTISDNQASDNGGGIYVGDYIVGTMSGGTISGNQATNGGGLYLCTLSTLTMSGGTIGGANSVDANKATNGGGAYVNFGTLAINNANAKIMGNTATGTGGGVYLFNTNSTLDLSAGTISGNTANSANSVYVGFAALYPEYGCTLKLSGAPTLPDVTLGAQRFITLTDEYTGAPIPVTLDPELDLGDSLVITSGLSGKAETTDFTTTQGYTVTTTATGELQFTKPMPVVDVDYTYDGVDDYEILTPLGLKWLAYEVNTQQNTFEGKTVTLKNDIDLDGYNWTAIGTGSTNFKGTFDGAGHQIQNLYIHQTDVSGFCSVGLFRTLAYGTVKNLGVVDVEITVSCSGIARIGGIAATASSYSNILNCYITGAISGTSTGNAAYVGGIAGEINSAQGKISNTFAAITIAGQGSSDNNTYLGGLVGGNIGMVADCYWLSTAIEDGFGSGTGTNCNGFTGNGTMNGVDSALLSTLNRWVALENSEDYYTWKQESGTPFFNIPCVPVPAAEIGKDVYYSLEDAIAKANEGGDVTVTLLRNIVTKSTLHITADMTLDLAGFDIQTIGTGSVLAIGETNPYVYSFDVTFTLQDNGTQTTRYITGVGADATITTEDKSQDSHYVAVTGGVIYGGTGTTENDFGGGVFMDQDATFHMESGTIAGNTADVNGGGVYVSNNGAFLMDGGSIVGNTATSAGSGVYVGASSSATFSGSPKVFGNTTDNVYLASGQKVTVGEAGLSKDAKVGISVAGLPTDYTSVSISDNGGAYVKNFVSDHEDYAVKVDAENTEKLILAKPYDYTITTTDGSYVKTDTKLRITAPGTYNISMEAVETSNKPIVIDFEGAQADEIILNFDQVKISTSDTGYAPLNSADFLGQLTITGQLSTTCPHNNGIYVDGALTITDATVTALGGTNYPSILADTLTVSGADTVVTVDNGMYVATEPTLLGGLMAKSSKDGLTYDQVVRYDETHGYYVYDDTGVKAILLQIAYIPSAGAGAPVTYVSTLAPTEHGKAAISGEKNTLGADVTITATPEDGYQVDTVVVTYSTGREVAVTKNQDGTYSYKQPGASVTVTVTFKAIDTEDGFFLDVEETDWFYDAVKWAVANEVTKGKTPTLFAPWDINTRGEAVTFLYRAMKQPDFLDGDKFTDLMADSFYENAVLWAVENGITQGTTDTTFSPDDTCTRAHIITFLWRMAGKPVVNSLNPFTDVAVDDYYYDAVLWAVGAGITEGTSSTAFSPDAPCTRSEIVTFLYRYSNQ